MLVPSEPGLYNCFRVNSQSNPLLLRKSFRLLVCFVCFGILAKGDDDDRAQMLPTGKRVTPLASPRAEFQSLDPKLKDFPAYSAGQAISTAMSPDKRTLLVLTSGYNRVNGSDGKPVSSASNEYVFVYDATGNAPKVRQVLEIPNTFAGIAFAPDGKRFYVSGGVDDNVHFFECGPEGSWSESGAPVKLGHAGSLGLNPSKESLAAGGVAVTADGKSLLVTNVYNDSVSVIDLQQRRLSGELDLRPGKSSPAKKGVPGGEYPFWIVATSATSAYVSSLRDREIVQIQVKPELKVVARIKVKGNPNKMVLNRDRTKLFIACDNTDAVVVVDVHTNKIVESIATTAPHELIGNLKQFTGSGPNDVALSNNERTLYASNGGTNSVAVIRLGTPSTVAGLIPTGWYPNSVSVSRNDGRLFIVNSKSAPGPNPDLHAGARQGNTKPGPQVLVKSRNQYIFQLEKAGLLTVPVPDTAILKHLTRVVAENNAFYTKPDPRDTQTMAALHSRIKHIIYIIKENRTYDQVLGDLGKGNGDPSLTEFGNKITPNFHSIARQFVDLDNFFNSGEVSGDGWPWSTSGRESDFGQKAVPLNYAGRGTSYEYEGPNRDINVGLATVEERKKANPKTPDDPDLLPGAINVAEPDGPMGSPQGKGYIWDAVLRAGLTFREYGCMSDTVLDSPREPYPFKNQVVMSRPANPELYKFGDPYYRGFDPGYPDFYREAEWEREFDQYAARGDLPAFEIVQLPVDHMGDFKTAISGVNTPETQQADNDYATARLIDRVAHSAYRDSTLIFIVEDDAQDGPDHVDAHRSTAYIVGPFVKHGAVVSSYYTTVSMLRTMEDILGLQHLNLNTATTRPMTDVFDLGQKEWSFDAKPSAILLKTQLPLSAEARRAAELESPMESTHGSDYWAARTAGFDFSAEDRVDAQAFNRIVWQGLMPGPYPERP